MRDKKKTEVTIGFTMHYPSFISKEMGRMKKADVVFLEGAHQLVREIRAGKSAKELVKSGNFLEEEYAEKYVPRLKKLIDSGKTIIGYENLGDRRYWKPEEAQRLLMLQDTVNWAVKADKPELFARAEAEMVRLREEKSVAWLKANIPHYQGNIYIDAGAIHTPIWHELKRDLEKKGIAVRADFLTQGKYRDKRIKVMYHPSDRLVRSFRFKTDTAFDQRKIRKLANEDKEFRDAQSNIVWKRQERGLPFWGALERNTFRMMRRKRR